VRGRVDTTTAPQFGARLTEIFQDGSRGLVLDLHELEYISSAGFRELLLAARRADKVARRLILCSIPGKVQQIFDIGGFVDLFSIAASRDEALNAAR
jgi:anti-anti-sigma factor